MKLKVLEKKIISCTKCKRLISHCKKVAQEKRRAYKDELYWGKPVPSFGDPHARILIIGLAPAAHGANRTGRMFTGDRSGDWLYRALHKQGFANQSQSSNIKDGLTLKDVFITASAHCAPPQNKPTPKELLNCASYLQEELKYFENAKVYLVLGQIALDAFWKLIAQTTPKLKKPKFKHGGEYALPSGKTILMSYHPSQQNTFTGRLTEPMFDAVFTKLNRFLT